MLKVLWVEDEKWNIDEYRKEHFDELFSEPIVPISFKEACEYTQDNLGYDFVIIDINLEKFNDFNSLFVNKIKEKISFEAENAGIVIFTMLLESGFPKERILFLTGNAHDTYGKFEEYFNGALMPLPGHIDKRDPDTPKQLTEKLEPRINPYLTLRRGIIEGCKYLKDLPEEALYFNSFIKDTEKKVNLADMHDYLDVLENFLPLREPPFKATFYKLFIRTLTHEWEAVEPKNIKGLASIMKSTRNWITHNSALFNALDENMVAYLFIINMRQMFIFDDPAQSYEKILLELFKALDEKLFDDKNKNKLIDQDFGKAYCNLQNIASEDKVDEDRKSIKDAFRFFALANNIQASNSPLRTDKHLFTKLLYQMFWLINSYPRVDTKTRNELTINFSPFVYKKNTYLYELARHIYSHSFS